jgi:hypothetical protein
MNFDFKKANFNFIEYSVPTEKFFDRQYTKILRAKNRRRKVGVCSNISYQQSSGRLKEKIVYFSKERETEEKKNKNLEIILLL